MSTNNNRKVLNAAQMKANRAAIHAYIINQTKIHGGLAKSPVILVPEFTEDTDGNWIPMQSNGVRATSKEDLGYMRLGQAFLRDNLTAGFLLTNTFADEAQMTEGLALVGISVGDAIPGKVLVVEESLTPFNATNPNRDIKVAGDSGITCTFTGEMPDAYGELKVYDNAPIYRRISLKKAGTESTTIQHTNIAEIQAWNAAQRAKSMSAGIRNTGNTAARIAELKAIPKAKRTPEQVAELADLMD